MEAPFTLRAALKESVSFVKQEPCSGSFAYFSHFPSGKRNRLNIYLRFNRITAEIGTTFLINFISTGRGKKDLIGLKGAESG